MINFPNNLPNFFLTQISSREKPFILKTADYLLAPLRIPTSYEQTVINEEGLPRKTEDSNIKLLNQIVAISQISTIVVFFGSPIIQSIVAPLYLSAVFTGTSLVIAGAKDLNTYFFKKIDENGDFFGCKLLKGVALVISASLPIFVGSFGLFGIYLASNLSVPLISLIALGSLTLQLSAGALLKVIAYNRNPKIKLAYDQYCKKNTDHLDITLSKQENEVLCKLNIIEQSLEKLENKENIGLLNHLNADVTGLILSSYLPINDLIQFRSANKKLVEVFSNKMIVTLRIKDSFSIDFINKLGLEHILKALEHDALDPLLVPVPPVLNFNRLRGEFEREEDLISSFEFHMENKTIAWGHESAQTPINKSKLFLIFNDITKPSMENVLYANEKYKMISSHDNSEISWEQRSIKSIELGGSDHFASTIPIYKVDEDHYSIDTLITKTDFFKNFKKPEALTQI